MLSSRGDQRAVDRQPAQRHAGRGVDRVAQSRRPRRDAGLADAAGRLAALDDMDFDLRRLVDAQHPVVVEVRLLHPALLDGDLAVERGGEAEDEAALELRRDGIRIDGDAGIDRAGDAPQMHLALLVDLGLDHGGDEAAERRLHAHAAADPRRQRLAPAGFLRDQIERRVQSRLPCPACAPEGDGSLPALRAGSSMKHSMAKTLLLGPTPRQNPVGTAGGSARTYSTWRFGMS